MHSRIDLQRIRQILSASYWYYSKDDCRYETLGPVSPSTDDLLAGTLTASMDVLDVGCGDGRTLRRHAHRFARGVGLDEQAEAIAAAQRATPAVPEEKYCQHMLRTLTAAMKWF